VRVALWTVAGVILGAALCWLIGGERVVVFAGLTWAMVAAMKPRVLS
jgi:hypothetical protein